MRNLYHYTSVDGFEGIIANNSIRMTKSEFLNDPYDCHMFIKMVEKYLEAHSDEIRITISKLRDCSKEVEELYFNKRCNLISYIEYIQKNIGLYVMSLTKEKDALNMWNYYGHGGMQLDFSMDSLTDALRGTFVSEKEFLTESKVIYANMELDIEKINVPDFSNFVLMNNESRNIFTEHRSFIKENSYYQADQLYTTSNLGKFIATYTKGYVTTLEYLLKKKIIRTSMETNNIFAKVFDNISKLDNFYFWKHDLSLYMLVLSALIKSDTYAYENEHRIVYFEYSINTEKKKKEEYSIKSIEASRFIYPYITFKKDRLLNSSLKGVTISPVTSNLPIDNEVYKETLEKFLDSKGYGRNINLEYSKHSIRW